MEGRCVDWDKESSSIIDRGIQTGFVKGCVMSGFRTLVSHNFGGSRFDRWEEMVGVGARGGEAHP